MLGQDEVRRAGTDSLAGKVAQAPEVSWDQACARRLDRHSLSAPLAAARPAEVVAAMCGAHAQVMSAAELSIGLRMTGWTNAGIRDALWRDRSLVKTYGPRGTVHLLPARDLPMWTAALSAVPRPVSASAPAAGLTSEQTGTIVCAIDAALRSAALGGGELTVDELGEAVLSATGPWAGEQVLPAFGGMWPRWRQAIALAANRGALCFGPMRGRRVTYTSPSRWLPGFGQADERSALAELVTNYLRAYGPASPRHFAQWFGAPRQWASDLFDSLAGQLRPVQLAGALAWLPAADSAIPDSPVPAAGPEGVRLLPYFDPYVVGSHPRPLLFPGRAADSALAHGQAGTFPVLLINGTVAGIWCYRRSGRLLDITAEPFTPLSAAQRTGLHWQAGRIGDILQAETRLSIGTVTIGPHA